jgi:hypothetical protein
VPTLSAPLDDAVVRPPVVLVVNNASSSQTGARTYDFQFSDDASAFAGPGAGLPGVTGIPEGAGQTSYQIDRTLKPGTRYFWRARAVTTSVVGTWSATYKFRTEDAPNPPPVIQSLTSSSPRAEVNQNIQFTALVTDQETRPEDLTYEWSATGGLFSGSGSSVVWRAPSVATPAVQTITLTVIERYSATGPDGTPIVKENRVTATATMHLNDSQKELNELVLTFLDDFVHSERSPQFCVRNFSDNCHGKSEELADIQSNRAQFVNDPAKSSFSISSITYNTGSRPEGATSATVLASCHFYATNKATGAVGIANGTCELTGVYENWQWRLCDSHFLAGSEAFSRRFIF